MDNSKPQAFIFMKVGSHGCEKLHEILDRKKIELKEAGMIFWGYGGTVLNPPKTGSALCRAVGQRAGLH